MLDFEKVQTPALESCPVTGFALPLMQILGSLMLHLRRAGRVFLGDQVQLNRQRLKLLAARHHLQQVLSSRVRLLERSVAAPEIEHGEKVSPTARA
jgi:hypothetical protein